MTAFVIATATVLLGCEKSDDKIRQISDIQGQEAAKNQVQAEKEYLEKKAQAMEADLLRRQRFYQAVSGTYEGAVRVNGSDYKIRLTLVPSLPRYVPDGRVRTVEEVASDLNGLNLNIQVVQWNPASTLGSVGCLVSGIRPDLNRGIINLVSESCANLYIFQIGSDASPGLAVDPSEPGRLSTRIQNGDLDTVSVLQGRMQPTATASVYLFYASRTSE